MRSILVLITVFLFSCHHRSFYADQRQIVAKDALRRTVTNRGTFDVLRFEQDTSNNYPDAAGIKAIRYTLEFTYLDSTRQLVSKTGEVIFPTDGLTVLFTNIK